MFKVGICGHFGGKQTFLDGQTVKTKTLADELVDQLGENSVICLDTYQWKKRPFKLLYNCFYICRNSENIMILPAHNGIRVFIPLFTFFNKIFRKKLFYIVVGGWLPEFVKKHFWILPWLRRIDSILVETSSMQNKLKDLGLKNVSVLPNFKRLKVLNENAMPQVYNKPYKLCTFSRVMKEKGIEDAIDVVKEINDICNDVVFTLDIYGQIDEDYKSEFETIISTVPDYIKYRGMVQYDSTVEVLKGYYLLLFPTYYSGEGFAGTLLDAFSAGVPVIATDWRYNSEIVTDKYTGLIYQTGDNKRLKELLLSTSNGQIDVLSMKKNCIAQASLFDSKNVIEKLIKVLD